jgi:hypothetical protein
VPVNPRHATGSVPRPPRRRPHVSQRFASSLMPPAFPPASRDNLT